MKLEALEKKHKELGEEIEKLKKGGDWPQHHDEYWLIYGDGEINRTCYVGDRYDTHRKLRGEVFKTKAEAEKHLNRQIAIGEANQIIKEENGDWVPDWINLSKAKSNLHYDHSEKRLSCDTWYGYQNVAQLHFFHESSYDKILDRITQEQINIIWEL